MMLIELVVRESAICKAHLHQRDADGTLWEWVCEPLFVLGCRLKSRAFLAHLHRLAADATLWEATAAGRRVDGLRRDAPATALCLLAGAWAM